MFWFRPQALKPLALAIDLLKPLPLEPLLHDGTPLHALERLTAHACEVAGFRWALLPVDDDPGHPSIKPWPKKLSVWDPQPEAYLAGVAALAEHHRHLKSKLAEREAAFADLNKSTARVRELEAEQQGLPQSLSWRLTGPLRRAKRLLQ